MLWLIWGFRYAAEAGHVEVLRLFLDRGGDPNTACLSDRVPDDIQNPVGWSALMDAAQGGHLAVVRLLLDRGADLTRGRECDRRVALHEAARCGQLEVTRLLLARGADPNAMLAPDDGCWTPVMCKDLDIAVRPVPERRTPS